MKKRLRILLSLVALFCAGSVVAEEFSKTWNFSDWEIRDYEGTTAVDGMTVYGPVSVASGSKTIDGVQYSNVLKMGATATYDESGAPTANALAFEVPGPVEITVGVARPFATAKGRYLQCFAGSNATLIGELEAPSSATAATFSYTGEATTIILGSNNNTINLYYVKVEAPKEKGPAPEQMTLVGGETEATVSHTEGVYLFESVKISGGSFYFTDAEGTTYGDATGATYVYPGNEYAFVPEGQAYGIDAGRYNVTLDWNTEKISVEKIEIANYPITVFWDNANTPEWTTVYAAVVLHEDIPAPEGITSMEYMGMTVYLYPMEYRDETLYFTEIPSASVAFGFFDGNTPLIVFDEEGNFAAPIANHLYTGNLTNGVALDMGEFVLEEKMITVYFHNSLEWSAPTVTYLVGDLAHSSVDDYVVVEMVRCSDAKVREGVGEEGVIYDNNVWKAEIPNITPHFAFYNKRAADVKYDAVDIEQSLAEMQPIPCMPRVDMVYEAMTFQSFNIAIELGRYDDVVKPYPAADIKIYWDNSNTPDWTSVSAMVVPGPDAYIPADKVGFEYMGMTVYEYPMTLAEGTNYVAEIPAASVALGFMGQDQVPAIVVDNQGNFVAPVAEHVYTYDAARSIAVDMGEYQEPVRDLTVYWDNSTAQFEQPYLIYTYVPMAEADITNITTVKMERCAQVPDPKPNTEGKVMEYDVWRAVVPSDAPLFGFCTMVYEPSLGVEVPANLTPAVDEATADYVKATDENVYAPVDAYPLCVSKGTYEQVVSATPVGGIQVYWDNGIERWSNPTVVYGMKEFEYCSSSDMFTASMQKLYRTQVDASDGRIYEQNLRSGSVPENAAWFAFCEMSGSNPVEIYIIGELIIEPNSETAVYEKAVENMVYGPHSDPAMVAEEFGEAKGLFNDVVVRYPKSKIEIFWDNTALQFAAPTLVYSMIPFNQIDINNADDFELVSLSRCAEVPPFQLEDEMTDKVYDFNVYDGKLPNNAAWFAFGDLAAENPLATLRPMGEIGAEGIAFGAPVSGHVYGVETVESPVAIDLGAYDDVVTATTEPEDATDLITIYWDNAAAAWAAPQLFYVSAAGIRHLHAMELCAEVPSQFIGIEASTPVYMAEVPASAVQFGFSDDAALYVVTDEAAAPVAPVEGHIYCLSNDAAIDNTDWSSVEGVAVDADGASGAEYYNLQGVRVANPARGTYIRVANGEATKLQVR